jgi:hypothetical protein
LEYTFDGSKAAHWLVGSAYLAIVNGIRRWFSTDTAMDPILIELSRKWDREPGDHFYGEPFDSAVDAAVGGRSRWSSPREAGVANPRAVIVGSKLAIELHETGPVLQFVAQHFDQIIASMSMVAGVVAAWAATRAARVSKLPADDHRVQGGTIVRIGDLRLETERTLTVDEISVLIQGLANTRTALDSAQPTITADVAAAATDDEAGAVSKGSSAANAARSRTIIEAVERRKKQLLGD